MLIADGNPCYSPDMQNLTPCGANTAMTLEERSATKRFRLSHHKDANPQRGLRGAYLSLPV